MLGPLLSTKHDINFACIMRWLDSLFSVKRALRPCKISSSSQSKAFKAPLLYWTQTYQIRWQSHLHKTQNLCNIIFVALTCFYLTKNFGEEKTSVLTFKNKVADEKKLVQSGKFEKIKDMKLSSWMFKFFNPPYKRCHHLWTAPYISMKPFITFTTWLNSTFDSVKQFDTLLFFERSSNTRMIEIQFWEGN